jgi:hypothetical protein
MRAVGLAIDVAAAMVALAVIAWRVLAYRRVVIDHVLLFSIGHLYYFSGALIAARLRVLDADYHNVYRLFDALSAERRTAFSLFSLGVLLAFYLGSRLAGVTRMPRPRRRSMVLGERGLSTAIAMVVGAELVLLAAAVVYRATILGGYRSNDPQLIQQQAGRGTLSAVASLVAASLLFCRHLHESSRRARGLRASSSKLRHVLYLTGLSLPVLILLAGGGRLFATTFLIGAAIWLTTNVRPVRRWVLLGIGALGVLSLSAFGSIRTGATPSGHDLAVYGTAESILTSVSLANFLDSPTPAMATVRPPLYLATDLVNAVPRAILPNKDQLRRNPEDHGFRLDNPLGGQSLGVSLLLNFGWLGALGAVAAAAYWLGRLRRRVAAYPSSPVGITYAVVAASLGMSLFRDPFSISLVRWWLVTATLMPALLFAIARIMADGSVRNAGFRAPSPGLVESQLAGE